jgi:hypothetical protein
MRRILQSLLVPLVAMVALWLPAVAAADELPADRVQLATEAVEGEQPGVPPGGPNDAANVNRPEEYEPNFLWGAAVGLAVLGVAGVAAVGALYYFMVHRPRTTGA